MPRSMDSAPAFWVSKKRNGRLLMSSLTSVAVPAPERLHRLTMRGSSKHLRAGASGQRPFRVRYSSRRRTAPIQREAFVIDRWCLVCSFCSTRRVGKTFPAGYVFDYDSYKILSDSWDRQTGHNSSRSLTRSWNSFSTGSRLHSITSEPGKLSFCHSQNRW
jgi:hypothetical protein